MKRRTPSDWEQLINEQASSGKRLQNFVLSEESIQNISVCVNRMPATL